MTHSQILFRSVNRNRYMTKQCVYCAFNRITLLKCVMLIFQFSFDNLHRHVYWKRKCYNNDTFDKTTQSWQNILRLYLFVASLLLNCAFFFVKRLVQIIVDKRIKDIIIELWEILFLRIYLFIKKVVWCTWDYGLFV